MKKPHDTTNHPPTPASRILASLQEAVDWAEGKEDSARATTIVPAPPPHPRNPSPAK